VNTTKSSDLPSDRPQYDSSHRTGTWASSGAASW